MHRRRGHQAEAGYGLDQIANDIGMSRQNVDHYTRLEDQMKVATDGEKRSLPARTGP